MSTAPATVTVGDTLPEQVIDITATLVVSTAIATRDYQDVHHDRDLAVEKGSKDIFMNILTSNGLAETFVNRWAGDEAFVQRVSISLGVPNYVGDTMTMTGEVTAFDADAGVADVKVVGTNSMGKHLTGTVTVALHGAAA